MLEVAWFSTTDMDAEVESFMTLIANVHDLLQNGARVLNGDVAITTMRQLFVPSRAPCPPHCTSWSAHARPPRAVSSTSVPSRTPFHCTCDPLR
jgi:hypothetical protein